MQVMASVNSGSGGGAAPQIVHQAHAEQDIIAQLAGALDSFRCEGKSLLRLAGDEADVAKGGERFDEEPTSVELAGELDRLFTKLLCYRYVFLADG